jgi:hypothetical protein
MAWICRYAGHFRPDPRSAGRRPAPGVSESARLPV